MHPSVKHWKMRLRARQPPIVRTIYRLLRSAEPVTPSTPLPDHLIRDCRFCSSRVAMLDLLPRNGCVAELGTFKGEFAREILTHNVPRELHLVDVDYSQFDAALLADDRIVRHEGLTTTITAGFPESYFDWIYVDAGHSYADVSADARASLSKLKCGGFLVFNDFCHIDPYLGRYGVHRAVTDFAVEYEWPIRFFAFQELAVYDIALQKPCEITKPNGSADGA